MNITNEIPEPVLFNPLKHYLPFVRDLINNYISGDNVPAANVLIKELKHIGNCVMDIYTGTMTQERIYKEVTDFLDRNNLRSRESYMRWAGTSYKSFRVISLSDGSGWTLKYHNSENRYVHIFPARSSPFTFRIKANTLKSAILYIILIGKDLIVEEDLNRARALTGLSPVKDVADTEAITEMIEILRYS
jgi:hypothetical protein